MSCLSWKSWGHRVFHACRSNHIQKKHTIASIELDGSIILFVLMVSHTLTQSEHISINANDIVLLKTSDQIL